MRANGAPSCTRLEASLRTSQKALSQPLVADWQSDRAFGETPMRGLCFDCVLLSLFDIVISNCME